MLSTTYVHPPTDLALVLTVSQVLGSHQNVLTTRLVEEFSLTPLALYHSYTPTPTDLALVLTVSQVLGSHQNVLTTRLVEEFSLTAEHTQILSLSEFPGGVHYHHDHAYMKVGRLMP